MIVCVCKKINSAQVKEAIDRGITDVEELSEQLGLGTGCGRCVEFTRQFVEQQVLIVKSSR
ncbi:MAG: (2Fe-2S)-binding protein [Pseudomonadales bacterium]|jgi:bacterioferritin-associated ferredoxin